MAGIKPDGGSNLLVMLRSFFAFYIKRKNVEESFKKSLRYYSHDFLLLVRSPLTHFKMPKTKNYSNRNFSYKNKDYKHDGGNLGKIFTKK